MKAFLFPIYRKSLIPLASSLIVTGCLPFGISSQSPQYEIKGLEQHQETKTYLHSILNNRLQEDIQAEADTEEFIRAENYREEMIALDLRKAMQARGYYDAKVEYVDETNKSLSGTYAISAGEQYKITTIDVNQPSLKENIKFPLLQKNEALIAEHVLAAQNTLYKNIQGKSCAFYLDVSHKIHLDKTTKTAEITFNVDQGPEAVFGSAIFEGAPNVKRSHLQKHVNWQEGECFKHEKIENLTATLLQTGLFSKAESTLPESIEAGEKVPVTITLQERASKTVKVGLNYYTDTGAGILLGWEHRNLLNAAEKLTARLDLNAIEQNLDVDFNKPFFFRKDQSLSINTAIGLEDTQAYEASNIEAGASISRDFTKHITASTGIALALSEIEDQTEKTTYGLISLPNSITFDNRSNPLDPHDGFYLTGSIEPFFDALGESDSFTKIQLGARTYLELADDPGLVLALRTSLGSIIGGDESLEIPATERFYAGGGGSVRGYGYQEVGPFVNGEPAGGRSIATLSSELRLHLTDSIGGVAFVDTGSVSESTHPDFDNMSVGAGLGLRYFTDFGPLRFDVAVPINRREKLDQTYQFYISIGQAF